MDGDPMERLRRLAGASAALKYLVALIVAAIVGVVLGTIAIGAGFSSSDAFLCALLAAVGAVTAVLMHLR